MTNFESYQKQKKPYGWQHCPSGGLDDTSSRPRSTIQATTKDSDLDLRSALDSESPGLLHRDGIGLAHLWTYTENILTFSLVCVTWICPLNLYENKELEKHSESAYICITYCDYCNISRFIFAM